MGELNEDGESSGQTIMINYEVKKGLGEGGGRETEQKNKKRYGYAVRS